MELGLGAESQETLRRPLIRRILEPLLEIEVRGEMSSGDEERGKTTVEVPLDLSATHLVGFRALSIFLLVVSFRDVHAVDERTKAGKVVEAIAERED